jgi:hypothetical protein
LDENDSVAGRVTPAGMMLPNLNEGGEPNRIRPVATKPTVSKFLPGSKGLGIITVEGTTSVTILAAINPAGMVPVVSLETVIGIEPVKALFNKLKLAHPLGSSIEPREELITVQASKLRSEATWEDPLKAKAKIADTESIIFFILFILNV